MFIGDETSGRHKRDNFPKDRAILSLLLGGLSLDMMVVKVATEIRGPCMKKQRLRLISVQKFKLEATIH